MGIPTAAALVDCTTMSMTQAKDYLAILAQCKKEGPFTDENLEIMHEALLAEADEKGTEPTRLALSLLLDLKAANRS